MAIGYPCICIVLALECTGDPADSPNDAVYALLIEICDGCCKGEEAVLHEN